MDFGYVVLGGAAAFISKLLWDRYFSKYRDEEVDLKEAVKFAAIATVVEYILAIFLIG